MQDWVFVTELGFDVIIYVYIYIYIVQTKTHPYVYILSTSLGPSRGRPKSFFNVREGPISSS